jgi:pimeloyl-ACP methyl ester carboxylesterase
MRAGPAGGVVASAIVGVALFARLITVPGAGHILGWEAADGLVQVVASFQD